MCNNKRKFRNLIDYKFFPKSIRNARIFRYYPPTIFLKLSFYQKHYFWVYLKVQKL